MKFQERSSSDGELGRPVVIEFPDELYAAAHTEAYLAGTNLTTLTVAALKLYLELADADRSGATVGILTEDNTIKTLKFPQL